MSRKPLCASLAVIVPNVRERLLFFIQLGPDARSSLCMQVCEHGFYSFFLSSRKRQPFGPANHRGM